MRVESRVETEELRIPPVPAVKTEEMAMFEAESFTTCMEGYLSLLDQPEVLQKRQGVGPDHAWMRSG